MEHLQLSLLHQKKKFTNPDVCAKFCWSDMRLKGSKLRHKVNNYNKKHSKNGPFALAKDGGSKHVQAPSFIGLSPNNNKKHDENNGSFISSPVIVRWARRTFEARRRSSASAPIKDSKKAIKMFNKYN